MSQSHAATAPTAAPLQPAPSSYASAATRALIIGIVGLVITGIGFFVAGDMQAFALSYLVGLSFWIAISIGILTWILIHHIFDASWSVTLRRLFE